MAADALARKEVNQQPEMFAEMNSVRKGLIIHLDRCEEPSPFNSLFPVDLNGIYDK